MRQVLNFILRRDCFTILTTKVESGCASLENLRRKPSTRGDRDLLAQQVIAEYDAKYGERSLRDFQKARGEAEQRRQAHPSRALMAQMRCPDDQVL